MGGHMGDGPDGANRESRNRVLIVDDEVFFLEAVDEILTEGGFDTVRAEDGASALELAADPVIGVVVLDVRLPDMDGIQALACLREMRPELSVIMLSASTDQEIVLEALRLGAADYLAKPLHDEELVLAVGRALGGFVAKAARRRLRERIDRLVEGMERLSQVVRLAAPEERVGVLRQGVVDSASVVLQASRASLMLVDVNREWLSVVASRGVDVDPTTMSARKVGEGASGTCFAAGSVLCVPDVELDARFCGRGAGNYEKPEFACVPLVCLGVPVGVLCLTDGEDADSLSLEEANVLRLLGMQISEFLAADPQVERLLASAQVAEVEGVAFGGTGPLDLLDTVDGDAEIAQAICEAVAAEVEPERVLGAALNRRDPLAGGTRGLHRTDPEGPELVLEAQADGGLAVDHERLPVDRGVSGAVLQTGQLVAAPAPDQDPRFDAGVDTAEDGLVRPLLCVPIRLREKVVGVVRVFLEGGARLASDRGSARRCLFGSRSQRPSVPFPASEHRGGRRSAEERPRLRAPTRAHARGRSRNGIMKQLVDKAKVLMEALPYMQRLMGKTIVIKYGGHAMTDEALRASFAADVVLLNIGVRPVIVHGGGPQIAGISRRWAESRPSWKSGGSRRRHDDGRRDGPRRKDQPGDRPAGPTGRRLGSRLHGKRWWPDAGREEADQRPGPGPRRRSEARRSLRSDGGDGCGDGAGRRTDRIRSAGLSYNVNADEAAGAIASALGAEIILLTDVDGVLDAQGSLISELTTEKCRALIEDGTIKGGMIPKMECCMSALRGAFRERTSSTGGSSTRCCWRSSATMRASGPS